MSKTTQVAGAMVELLCGWAMLVSQQDAAQANRVARAYRGPGVAHVEDRRGWYRVAVECAHDAQMDAAKAGLVAALKAVA